MTLKAARHLCRCAAGLSFPLNISAAQAAPVVVVLNSGDASNSLIDQDARREIRRYATVTATLQFCFRYGT